MSVFGFIGDAMDDLFGGGSQQAARANAQGIQNGMNAVQNYYNQGIGYQQPFYQAGVGSLPTYQNALNNMSNPSQYYNNIMAGYQMSPAAQFQMKNAMNNVNASAAANGMAGSSNALNAVAQNTQGIINQDQQQYFNNLNGINSQYMGGLQGLINGGYGAAGQMGAQAMTAGEDMANLYGQQGQNNANAAIGNANMWARMFGNAGSSLFGGFGGGNFAPVEDLSAGS